METTQRIKVKIGAAEFEAEGLPDLVKQQFDSFLQAVAANPTPPPIEPRNAAAPAEPRDDPPAPTPPGDNLSPELSEATMNRVFRQDGVLSLMALPKGANAASDAALVLLYGYTKLRDTPAVTGVTMMKSLNQSGLKVDRIDRTLEVHTDFVMAAGYKRGRRYSLNNRGLTEAERKIKELVS
jgi:hypothetical protein